MVILLVSLLLFLALATYHSGDPSMNTAVATVTPHNWIGLFGAYLSDLLLQALGITAFLLPLWLGGVGWTWMRSRPGGSPILRWMGTLLALTFLPTIFGLLPWHWRWLHVVPIEGVVGRLMSGVLVVYLNIQGAWVVAAALAAAGLYFASDISFGVIRESIAAVSYTHLDVYKRQVDSWLDQMTPSKIPAFNLALGVITGIAVIIGFLVIFQSMYTAVLERTREIGVLKSMGASKFTIVGVVLRESAALSAAGVILGIAGTYGARALIAHLFPTMKDVYKRQLH